MDLKKVSNVFCWPRRHRDSCTSATESHREKWSHLIQHRSCSPLCFTSSMEKERDINSRDVGCTLIQICLHLKAAPCPAMCIRGLVDKNWGSRYRKTDVPGCRHCNCRARGKASPCKGEMLQGNHHLELPVAAGMDSSGHGKILCPPPSVSRHRQRTLQQKQSSVAI